MIAKTVSDLLGREVSNKDYYNIKEIVIPDYVDNIFPNAFYKFRKLDSVILSKGVKIIENGAFKHCRHLKSVYLSDNVQEIGYEAFAYCDELETIVVDKNNKTFDSRDGCNAIICTKDNTLLVGCKTTIIPNGVKRIHFQAFKFNADILSVRIPESLHFFSINTFRNRSSICILKVDKNNSIFDSREECNAIIRKNGNALIYGCNSSFIPDGVETIDYRAFENCLGLTSIIIPASVHTIGPKAFYKCVNLASVTISDSILDIGVSAFSYCSKSLVFYIPNGSKRKFETLLPQYKSKLVEI